MNIVKPATYVGEDFQVTYDKETCTHAAVCVKTLPQVFNPKEKPWVNTKGASKEDIKNTVAKCPSGALQFKEGSN